MQGFHVANHYERGSPVHHRRLIFQTFRYLADGKPWAARRLFERSSE